MKNIAALSLSLVVGSLLLSAAFAASPAKHAAPAKHRVATPPPKPASIVSVTMPPDPFAFKPGPGVQVANTYCLTCHSAAYVSTQPPLSKDQWTAEVAKMRKVYAAQYSDAEAETIAAYLTATYGKQ